MVTGARQYPQRSWLRLAFGRFGWLFALLLCLGLLGLVAAAQEVRNGWTFNNRAVEVTGRIDFLAIGASPCTKGDGGDCPKTIVRYHFNTPDGAVRGEARIGPRDGASLRHGGPILLRSLPGDPAQQEVEYGSTLRHGVFGLAISALFALIGSCFGSYVWWANHMIWLRKTGEVRRATVSSAGPERDPLLKTWFIRWGDDAGGEGKSQWYWSPDAQPRAAEPITVFADPAGKRPAVWEGDCGTRHGGASLGQTGGGHGV